MSTGSHGNQHASASWSAARRAPFCSTGRPRWKRPDHRLRCQSPTAIPSEPESAVRTANSVIAWVAWLSIPILSAVNSVNHRLPSGPATIVFGSLAGLGSRSRLPGQPAPRGQLRRPTSRAPAPPPEWEPRTHRGRTPRRVLKPCLMAEDRKAGDRRVKLDRWAFVAASDAIDAARRDDR